MENEYKTSISFWEKVKLSKDLIAILMVAISLVTFVIFLWLALGSCSSCLLHELSRPSLLEIVLGSAGVVAISATLGLPLLSMAAFGGVVWVLIQLWSCQSSGIC